MILKEAAISFWLPKGQLKGMQGLFEDASIQDDLLQRSQSLNVLVVTLGA